MGHSFVRRGHGQALRHGRLNLDLAPLVSVGSIPWKGRKFAIFVTLKSGLIFSLGIREQDVLILDIGYNDLLEEFHLRPKDFAMKVFCVETKVRKLGAKKVAILRIFYRSGEACIQNSVPKNRKRDTRGDEKY